MDYKVRGTVRLLSLQAIGELVGNWNRPSGRFGLQAIRKHRLAVLESGSSPHINMRRFVQMHAVPLQTKDLFGAKAGVQPDHAEQVRRAVFDGVHKDIYLIVIESRSLRGFVSPVMHHGARIFLDQPIIKSRSEDALQEHKSGIMQRVAFVSHRSDNGFDVILIDFAHCFSLGEGLDMQFNNSFIARLSFLSEPTGIQAKPLIDIVIHQRVVGIRSIFHLFLKLANFRC